MSRATMIALLLLLGCAPEGEADLAASEKAATAAMPSPFRMGATLAANFTINTFPYLVCEDVRDTWTISWQECRDGTIWECRDVYCRGDMSNQPRERQCMETTRPCGDNYLPTRTELVETFPATFPRDVRERVVKKL